MTTTMQTTSTRQAAVTPSHRTDSVTSAGPEIPGPALTTPKAFTLIELLVVIAIVAVLISLLLPALAGARRHAQAAVELAASRQLMQGYLGYSMDHKDALIPGRVPDPAGLFDELGGPLSPAEAGKRWPWRLAAYLAAGSTGGSGGGAEAINVRGSLLVNERAAALADRSSPMWAYQVSLTPSLGLNFLALGGDLGDGPRVTVAIPSAPTHATTGPVARAHPGHDHGPPKPIVITQLNQAVTPHRMLVFTSARSNAAAGGVIADGHHKIVPPTVSFEFSAAGWATGAYAEAADPAAWGYVHPRWPGRGGGAAVTANLDGHAQLLGATDLRDMTRWVNRAAIAGRPEWRPN